MDKRSIIAVGICFLILLLYPYFLKLVYPPASRTKIPEVQGAPQVQPQVPTEQPTSAIPSPNPQWVPKYDAPEEEFVVENNQMRVELTNWGGCIRDIGLKYFHSRNGEMVRLAPRNGSGWKTMQLLNAPGNLTDAVYTGAIEGRKIVFESKGDAAVSVRKTYVFAENGYEITGSFELYNKSHQEVFFEQGLGIAVGSFFAHEAKEGLRAVSIDALDSLGNVWRKNAGRVKEVATEMGSFQWVGLQNQYYAIIVKPDAEMQGLTYAPLFNAGYKVEGCQAAMIHTKFKLAPGSTMREQFLIYSGPKSYFQLKSLPHQFYKIIDFGIFGPISKGILYLLHYMYIPFHSYGIAIILMTVLVKVLTYPLTAVSFKSMKRMQALQPHITGLKEKHKDNPKKLQKEMMELYKEHKVNPMGGCLPMLIQLPIFVALYTALQNAIELKGSSFLWMRDLSMPDTVAVVAGLPINILPIIMGGTMIWQQKMSTVDPAQAKMMMFMPIFFTFIFYSFPSGLVLYWLVNNVLSILQQYQVQRQKM